MALILVNWVGDKPPHCWQIIKKSQFLKPHEIKEGAILDAIWKANEESSPAEVLKIHDSKTYLQTVKEQEYFRPWKNETLPTKRVKAAPKNLDSYVTDEEASTTASNKEKKVTSKKTSGSSKKGPAKKKPKKSEECQGESSEVEDTSDTEIKEFSKSTMKSSKEEADKVLADAILKKKRATPEPTMPLEKKEDPPFPSLPSQEEFESDEDISEQAKEFGLVPPIRKTKDCCAHCKEMQSKIKDLDEELTNLKKKIRLLTKKNTGLAEKIDGLGEIKEADPGADLEKTCRQLTSNSTSLYLTVKTLLKKLFTDEEILNHSVSGKASNSKTVAKPRFDTMKIELIRKIASELHGSQITSASVITHKIQAVQKAVKRELEGPSTSDK